MEEDNAVLAEQPAPEPAPETSAEPTPEETPPEPEATPAEQPEEDRPEERPSRAQERIRDTIAARKEAERIAEEKAREAEYWKQQALSRTPEEPDALEGVTDEGIDPVAFARSLKAQILKEVQREQGLTQAQQRARAEELEVSSQPEMKDDFFRDYTVNYARANNVSPWEAFQVAKERFSELEKKGSQSSKARDEAGRFVRQETATPAAGRGTSSASANPYFTREQIDRMSLEDYRKNEQEISRQLALGLIK